MNSAFREGGIGERCQEQNDGYPYRDLGKGRYFYGPFVQEKKKISEDTRPRASRDMSPDEFTRLYDLTFQYRERILPEAFSLEPWEKSEVVRFSLERGLLRNDILDVGRGAGEIDIIFGMKGYNICGLDDFPTPSR